jgi:hypothetical protein
MRRSRKIILISLLAIVVLAGSIGGVALAVENGDESGPKARCGAFLEKVCDNYEDITGASINCTALKEAFAEAGNQMRAEIQQNHPEMDPEAMQEAMKERLQERYEAGEITQEQYEKMMERIESMPDDAPFKFGFRGHFGPRGGGPPCEPAEE